MFASSVRESLQARHFLKGDFGDESVPHRHPYLIEVVSRTKRLDDNGFSTDIAVLHETLYQVLGRIQNVLLNNLPFFLDKQTSLENLCVYLHREMTENLRKQPTALPEELEIRIWESDTAWASYDAAVDQ